MVKSLISFGRLPSWAGMLPLSWLLESARNVRLVRFLSLVGMGPLSWLEGSMRDFRCVTFPSSAGIVPLSRLEERSRLCRFVRFPSWAGILPLSWFPPSPLKPRVRDVMLLPVSLQRTPYQVHSVPTAPSQLVFFFQWAPSVLL